MLWISSVFFCLFMSRFTSADEPTCACSKFHYEEQMLEKMVRMEFDMKRIKTETEEARKGAERAIEEFKQIKIAHEQNMEKNEKEIEKLKDSVRIPTVAFKARKVQDQSPGIDETIIFTETFYNYGEQYNNITGIFIAPVSGTYLFTIQFCYQTKKYMYYAIMVENERVTNGMFYEHHNYNCNTADAIVVLKSGDRVWVQFLRSSTTGSVVIEGNNDIRWNTFSGTLIHV